MMGNRRQPFGYCMELGRIVPCQQETEIVKMIFEQYQKGASIKQLAVMLNEQSVPYEDGKLWNKNMAARILADERYLGTGTFPALIDPDTFQSVQHKRTVTQCPAQKTRAQKMLRRLSGSTANPRLEQAVRNALNGLILNPERIQKPVKETIVLKELAQLKAALDAELGQQPIDEDKAKQFILQIAAAEYAALGPEEYETQRLRRIFQRREQMSELDAELLETAVKRIIDHGYGKVDIQLKNDQII